jgi:type I restriction enzyme S subunit
MTLDTTSTPRLRFPEFQDAAGWDMVPMGQLLVRSPEYGINAPAVPYSEQLPTYLRITDIDDDGRFLRESKVSVAAPVTEENYLSIGDIVLARTGASVGKSYRYRETDGRLVYAGFLIRVRPDLNKLVPEFAANYITTRQYWNWVRMTSARSGQPGINGSEYATLPVTIPRSDGKLDGLAEQRKIAACLGSLDEWIGAEAAKLEALSAHKNGLMQQLFPRPGESRPRLRLPEFHNADEWEMKHLGDVITVASGQVDPTESPYCDLPHVGGENIESDTGNLRGLRSASEDGVISGKYPFDENDVLYSKIRPALNKVAMPDFKGICSSDIYPVRPSNGDLLRDYLLFLLRSESFVAYATKHSARGKIPKINREALNAYGAVLPSPTEQARIAGCLSSLDAVLAAQARKVAGLKAHKTGMMQQLFPSGEGA